MDIGALIAVLEKFGIVKAAGGWFTKQGLDKGSNWLGGLRKPKKMRAKALTLLNNSTTRRLGFEHSIKLNFEEKPQNTTQEHPKGISWDEILSFIQQRQHLLIEAEPGAGKTTTLLQIGLELLEQKPSSGRIAFEVSLSSSTKIIDTIIEVFEPVADQGRIKKMAEEGVFVLLCDGWNELSKEQQQTAQQKIDDFLKLYPKNTLVLATRQQRIPPYIEGLQLKHLSLKPLSYQQQRAIAEKKKGVAGIKILESARQLHGINDILRIPFFLNAIIEIADIAENLPRTKEAILERFVQLLEARNSSHGNALRHSLDGRQQNYLQAMASSQANTRFSGDTARQIIQDERNRLLGNSQISSNHPQQQEILDMLVARHLLVAEGNLPNETHLFQHQQFQEWFASFKIQELLLADSLSWDVYDTYVNQPVWEESLFFAVERLAASNTEQAQTALRNLVLRTLGIDPLLASAMIARISLHPMGNPFWASIQESVFAFLAAWEQESVRNGKRLCRAFKLASNRPEFADDIWQEIEATEPRHQLAVIDHVGRYRFRPTVLGSEWRSRLLALGDTKHHRNLYWMLSDAGYEGMCMVADALRDEPSAEVFVFALELLEWRGGAQLVEQLLETASVNQWSEITKRGSLEIVSHEKYRPKINEILIQEIRNSSHPISLYLKLKKNGGTVDSKKLIDAAMLMDQEDFHYKHRIFQEISALYPEELSITIIERALRGDRVPSTAWDFVKPSKKLNQKKMLAFCLHPSEEGRHHKPIKEVSKLLTLKSVRRALKGYMQFQSLPREEQWQRHAELSPYRDILRTYALSEADSG
jgi:hypothetical protein